MKEHNDSKNISTKYTRGRRPVTLVHVEKMKTVSDALKREREIKKLPKEKKRTSCSAPEETEHMISPKGKNN